MKNSLIGLVLLVLLSSFVLVSSDTGKDKEKINRVLDNWHKAAAEAKYDTYFNLMTSDAVFIGTDATENWNKTQFQAFSKPFFERGKAWNFRAIERHIYFDTSMKTAWFDELLDTQMKICRGSGILIKVGNDWKIRHYVLSMTVPNDKVTEVVKIKTPIENTLLEKLSSK